MDVGHIGQKAVMKSLSLPKTTAVALAFALGTSQGSINFVFDLSDPSNAGLWSSDRIAALERSASAVEALFVNYSATLEIEVKSENDPLSSTLASAGSNDFVPTYTPGFSTSDVVMNEILTGLDGNGAGFDGVVNVNWGSGYDTSAIAANVAAGMFDFESTMIHELLHAVGFLSTVSQTGTDAFGNTTAGDWNPFDQYVGNGTGLLINQTNFDINQSGFVSAVTGGAGTAGLAFHGPNATAANGGNPVFLYTPTTFEDGSSGSHLDDEFYMGTYMMEASTNPGPGIRAISPVEQAILRDIGYVRIPEPSAAALMGIAGLLLVGRRRRR